MFGIYLPNTLYKAVPYAFLLVGCWAIISTNSLGAISGLVLILVALLIWKMRSAAKKAAKAQKAALKRAKKFE